MPPPQKTHSGERCSKQRQTGGLGDDLDTGERKRSVEGGEWGTADNVLDPKIGREQFNLLVPAWARSTCRPWSGGAA